MANYRPIKIAGKAFESPEGSDDKLAPVIFLHGSCCSKEIWGDIPQLVANKTKRKTYIFDQRNHGESEYTEDYSFDLNVDDLFHFMDGLNIEKTVLVGQSIGGLTVSSAALRKPERVEMVFSEDMYVKRLTDDILEAEIKYMVIWDEIIQNISNAKNGWDAYNQAIDILYEKDKDSEMFSSKEAMKKSNLFLKKKADGGYESNYNKDPLIKAFKKPETVMSPPTGEFNGPAYFMYGTVSPFAVNTEEPHIRKHFPKAEFIKFEGASHNIHVEFPEKYVQTLVSRLLQ